LKQLKHEIKGITSSSRQKRGLINFLGTAHKYLFVTLTEDDKKELEDKLQNLQEMLIENKEFNEIIQIINEQSKDISKLVKDKQEEKALHIFRYSLNMFLEYIEDLQMSLQLTRVGIFNPKILKHEELENINEEKLLSIKTSAWLSSQTKDTFILAHIPTSFKETQKYRIIKYPDNMGRQIDINDNYEYFVNDEKKVFYLENSPNSLANILDQKFIITDQCISQILTNQFAKCQHTFVSENESLKYIEPNIIITYNLKETQINQDCEMFNKTIQGNNIIQLSQCTLEIRDIKITTSKNIKEYKIILSSTNITLYEPIRLLKLKNSITYQQKQESIYKWIVFTILIIILLSITTYIIFTYRRLANKKEILFKFNKDVESSKGGASDVYANTLDTKPNIQPVYPEIPIIPIVNNISPEPTIAVIQINPT